MEVEEVAFRNLVEVLVEEEFRELLKDRFTFYWGIAPTGPIHMGYIVPLVKFIDLLEVGGKGKVLIADWHAYLDDRKTPWEEMSVRAKYCKLVLKTFFKQFGYDVDFVFGHTFQRKSEYMEDLVRASAFVTVKRAVRAGSEVVRMSDNPHVSELIYPIMQCLDVKHLKVDLALGGIDQRHIYALGREILPKLSYKPGVYVFTPLITGLKGKESKMSASKPETAIIFHDSDEKIEEKIRSAYCPVEKDNNPVLELFKFVVFPLFGEVSVVNKKSGEERSFSSYTELEREFLSGNIHPLDLKLALAEYMKKVIAPVRRKIEKKRVVEDAKESFRRQGYMV